MDRLCKVVTNLVLEYKTPIAFIAGTAIGVLVSTKIKCFKSSIHRGKWQKDPVTDYCYSHSNITESLALQQLRQVTKEHARSIMESTNDVGQLLVFLMRTIKAKNVIEVGTFTGVALLKMAEELPVDGKVFSLDVSEEYVNIGKPLIKRAGVLDKIDYRISPATETLVKLKEEGYGGKIDLCFIDADKPNYPNYYKLCMDLLRPGGIIVFDNSLFSGKVVYNSDQEPYCYIHEANEKATVDSRVTSMLLNIGDGCLILRKHD